MAQRTQLHSLLKTILGTDKVYFQPPSTIKIVHPCIIYKLEDMDISFANNKPYKNMKQYMITVIDSNPDSLIPDKIAALPLVSFDRFFTANNLNHYVYKLFF